jgi:hypothetical protein
MSGHGGRTRCKGCNLSRMGASAVVSPAQPLGVRKMTPRQRSRSGLMNCTSNEAARTAKPFKIGSKRNGK